MQNDEPGTLSREKEWNYWQEIQEEIRSTRTVCAALNARSGGNLDHLTELIQTNLTELGELLEKLEKETGKEQADLNRRVGSCLSRLRSVIQRAEDALHERAGGGD